MTDSIATLSKESDISIIKLDDGKIFNTYSPNYPNLVENDGYW